MTAAALDDAPAAGRNRALAFLSASVVLSMTTWFSASAVLPQVREDWALGGPAAAWLTIAVQLGFVLGATLSSILNLADVISPRVVLLAGATGAAAANLALVAAHGPGAAIPLRFATGFFLAGVYPPALKLMATWFRRGRGTALGIVVGALTLASAAPPFANGLGGAGGGGLCWRRAVCATAARTVAGGLLPSATVPEGPFRFPRATFAPRQAGLV